MSSPYSFMRNIDSSSSLALGNQYGQGQLFFMKSLMTLSATIFYVWCSLFDILVPASSPRALSQSSRPISNLSQSHLSSSKPYGESLASSLLRPSTESNIHGYDRPFSNGKHSDESLGQMYRGEYSNRGGSVSSGYGSQERPEIADIPQHPKSIIDPRHKVAAPSSKRQQLPYHNTPQATETRSVSSQNRGTPDSVAAASYEKKEYKSSPRQPVSVFNYEGSDRMGSRNHLHMMANHSLMAAQSAKQEEDSAKKRNLKRLRKKITVNLQGTRYDVGK